MSEQTSFSLVMVGEMFHQHASNVDHISIEDAECNREELVYDEELEQFKILVADLSSEDELVTCNSTYCQKWYVYNCTGV